MKLEKAIKIGEALDHRGHFAEGDEVTPALRLLIEAGKRVKASRVQRLADFAELLPGETEP